MYFMYIFYSIILYSISFHSILLFLFDQECHRIVWFNLIFCFVKSYVCSLYSSLHLKYISIYFKNIYQYILKCISIYFKCNNLNILQNFLAIHAQTVPICQSSIEIIYGNIFVELIT